MYGTKKNAKIGSKQAQLPPCMPLFDYQLEKIYIYTYTKKCAFSLDFLVL